MDAPELTLTAHQDLAVSLTRLGRYREAMEPLAVAQRLCAQHGRPLLQHQLELVAGMVLHGLGKFAQAAEAFEKARTGMRALGLGGYVALASLEFSLLRFHQGRYSEAATLASEALPLYGVQGIGREARAALAILRESVLADQLTEEILVHARDQLRCLNLDPSSVLAQRS
jgi:tetratricopeptide (TPR) repeat protein